MKILFTYAVRKLLKSKVFSAINILGLTLGFTGFMIVALFIRHEFSWDKVNANYDNIYRVQRHNSNYKSHDGTEISPHNYPITAAKIEVYPEIKTVTAIREEGGKYLSIDKEKLIYDKTGIVADQNFLDVFTYDFVEGTIQDALEEPFTILLSESMAHKLYPNESALGKTVLYEKKYDCKVKGVYTDLPQNSTIKPGYILSFSTLKQTENIERDKCWRGDFMVYALLHPDANPEVLESKIINTFENNENHKYEKLLLCPISKVYLSFNGKTDYLIILSLFGLIGLFILVMSAFNYVNFTMSTASSRGKEIAIRKVSGAGRISLVQQMLFETLVISLVASIIAILLVKVLLPTYNAFVNASISLSFIKDWDTVLLLILTSVIIGLLSGIFPARAIASGHVVRMLKEGLFRKSGRGVDTKKVLVGFQFTISNFLVCLTLIFVVQIKYMLHKDLGFDKENLLYSKIEISHSQNTYTQLKDRLMQHPEIVGVSMSSSLPFVNLQGGLLNWEGSDPTEKVLYRPNWVSEDFVENMKLKLIAGRSFSKDFAADKGKSCLINEAALRSFGWTDAIGKYINDNEWQVVGVVEDYHLYDIHNKIEPTVLLLGSEKMNGNQVFAVRYKRGSLDKTKAILSSEFNATFPQDPFQFESLESALLSENSIKIYKTIEKSVMFFTAFIILLTIVALLGSVSYSLARRKKEISIRKINGSPVHNLFLLLNKSYLVILGASLMLVLPLVHITHTALPGNFKTALPPWVPLFSTLSILLVIFLTTGYQTYKAATRNPVEALKYE